MYLKRSKTCQQKNRLKTTHAAQVILIPQECQFQTLLVYAYSCTYIKSRPSHKLSIQFLPRSIDGQSQSINQINQSIRSILLKGQYRSPNPLSHPRCTNGRLVIKIVRSLFISVFILFFSLGFLFVNFCSLDC